MSMFSVNNFFRESSLPLQSKELPLDEFFFKGIVVKNLSVVKGYLNVFLLIILLTGKLHFLFLIIDLRLIFLNTRKCQSEYLCGEF